MQGGRQHITSPVNHNSNNKWPHITIWDKCTPIFGLNVNIFKCSGHISRFRHDFMRQHWCIISDWTGSTQLHYRIFYCRDDNFKMCAGVPKCPNTCKLQHFKICCRFWSISRNQGMFCDRKRCHNSKKHIEEMVHLHPINKYAWTILQPM